MSSSSETSVQAFRAERIWTLQPVAGALTDHAVLAEAGRVTGVVPLYDVPGTAELFDFGDADLVPGLVDIQVNGGGGVLFNDDPSVETIQTIVRAHRQFGTTSLLPTYITDSEAGMRAARAAVDACLVRSEPGVLGVHFEGPFLDDRKTGAHDRTHVRGATDGDLEAILDRAEGLGFPGATLVTAAATRLTDQVAARLLGAGAIVALGHCASTFEEANAALSRGATGLTHLYNAMSPLESRAPGLVGAAFASDSAYAGLILDGVHVAYGAARAAFHALGKDRLILVTDAVQPVGTDMTEFGLGGQRVTLKEGRCINEEGNLAGSALDMATAIRNAVEHLGLSFEDAIRCASLNPARFLGLEREVGSLAVGTRADMAIFDPDRRVLATVVRGTVHDSAH